MDDDRILSTHTGSLPRPDDLIRIMWAVGDGIPVDQVALEARVEAAVHDVVERQVSAGVSIVNDGEMSKPSYATYVKDRLHGFGGEAPQTYRFQDLDDYPLSAQRVADNPGRRKRSAPACTGPITVRDTQAAHTDMRHLTDAARRFGADATFSSAASPGVVSLFFRNDYYPSHEEYVFAIAEAMRHEYEAIAAAGATVQLDCPDLAMGRHSAYAGDGSRRVPAHDRDPHRGDQPRRAQHPRRPTPDAPLLGQLPRPPPPRRAPRRHRRPGVEGQAEHRAVRGCQSPPRPRVGGPGRARRARRQGDLPWRDRAAVELHRAP